MPFAALPSSPGFQQPQAPDWGRFAALAIEGINKGSDIRAQAGRDLVAGIDKSLAQVSKIMEMRSPAGQLKKHLEMEGLKVQQQMYNEYKAMTPEQRRSAFTIKNGSLQYADPYKNILNGVRLTNGALQTDLLRKRLAGPQANSTDAWQRQASAAAPVGGGPVGTGPVTTGEQGSSSGGAPGGTPDSTIGEFENVTGEGDDDNENTSEGGGGDQ
jgi:hypothetical protein